MSLQYFTFPAHTIPKGQLPADRRAQACWYFYLLAHKVKERVGNSIDDQFGVLEGEPWMDKNYEQIARTVSLIYELESPDEFAKFWDYVEKEAHSCGLPTPAQEYRKPLRLLRMN